MKNLFLIDGSGFIFRAFYALPPLTNPDGIPINALYRYCNMILNIYEKFKPDEIIVVFDTKKKTFRNDIYKDYKSNRTDPPEELIPQFSIIRDATDALQIPRVEIDGYEADDIIATYAKQAEKKGISGKPLRTASERLNIRKIKSGFTNSHWVWSLPEVALKF